MHGVAKRKVAQITQISTNKLTQILRKVSNNKQLYKKMIHPESLCISLFGMLNFASKIILSPSLINFSIFIDFHDISIEEVRLKLQHLLIIAYNSS